MAETGKTVTLTEMGSRTNVALILERLQGEAVLVERLQEMGLIEGLEFTLLHRLPMGGPWIVQFHSTFLALRNDEASALQVTVLK